MAMSKGLSAAMINPNKKEIMLGFRTACALLDQDPNEETYIQTSEGMNITSDMPQCEKPNEADGSSLYRAVIKGMKKEAEEITRTLIREGKKPMSIIDEEVIPALDTVGKGFEKGTVFLPQLLMSADAATAATIPVKEAMAKAPAENKGTVILATVKGDIHDIGKNIVRIMLENYGYEVIDLGRDVDKETIVTAALEKDVKLVGLSALMTTTVPAMEETIALLHEKKPDVKVMVGGAVLTQEAADRIHADAYGKDAMAAVRYADQVFGTDH
jgi:5-methyltetrahydrofolate--homocysteine methyltransferase